MLGRKIQHLVTVSQQIRQSRGLNPSYSAFQLSNHPKLVLSFASWQKINTVLVFVMLHFWPIGLGSGPLCFFIFIFNNSFVILSLANDWYHLCYLCEHFIPVIPMSKTISHLSAFHATHSFMLLTFLWWNSCSISKCLISLETPIFSALSFPVPVYNQK